MNLEQHFKDIINGKYSKPVKPKRNKFGVLPVKHPPLGSDDGFSPRANPNDLPQEQTDWRDNEAELN